MRSVCRIVMFLNIVEFISPQFRQEGAVVLVCNQKYLLDCNAITRRSKRGEPYTTNYTAISKYEMGNNVTFKATIQAEGYTDILVVKQKVCDIIYVEWLSKYLSTYSNIDVKRCPWPAGPFQFTNLMFPPKGMPQRIPSSFVYKLAHWRPKLKRSLV